MKHAIIIVALSALIVLAIVYPFLPGEYDPLALPVSIMIQALGWVGLPLVLVGLIWLAAPKRAFPLAIAAALFGTFVVLITALLATLSVGKILGALAFLVGAGLIAVFISQIKTLRNYSGVFNPTPVYLIVLPLVTLLGQLILTDSITNWSRNRAIAAARQHIEDLERHYAAHGSYPINLHAQHKDYQTGVVGVEKFFYAPQGDGYNLSFEQPRFFSDQFGTREWVVYNPRDENRMYSHVTWLMPGAGSSGNQGWYESANTEHKHWKVFWFD